MKYYVLLFLSIICLSCQSQDYKELALAIPSESQYVILVDYSIPSNKSRMFVYDYNEGKIIKKFWCAHGFGGGSTDSTPVFSNKLGSNCSSLGLYSIDKWEGTSPTYGYKYHMVDGLSSTNSNARKRQILIHSWYSVTQDCRKHISSPMACDYRSAGCFTTTDSGYKYIHNLIKSSSSKVMLYAFNGIDDGLKRLKGK